MYLHQTEEDLDVVSENQDDDLVSIDIRQYELLTCYYIDSVHVVSSSSE